MVLLGSVGLADPSHHHLHQLSGGEQQRVAIARGLSHNPLLVLADEPTANLDTDNSAQAMGIMQCLNEEIGTAFVFATHDPRIVACGRRLVELRNGKIENGDVNYCKVR
jgi:putative ABC transport system ATP-binding protein